MKRIYLILPIIILALSCNTSNKAEKEYIKNLEEKNRLLEQEIADLKNDSKNIKSIKAGKNDGEKFFSIGSTEKEVLAVMGNPTSYNKLGPFRIMNFGLSSVKFEKGKVTSYDNFDGNLKVKLTE